MFRYNKVTKIMWLFALLCLWASSAEGASSVAPAASSKAYVPADRIQALARKWQERLHLDEWKIETRVVRQCDLKPDTLGNLRWELANHTAVIRVLSPLDYGIPMAEVPDDMEYTVVHELIHLQLAVLPRDANAKATEEQVVNRIADALMALDKGPEFRARSVIPSKIPGGSGEPKTNIAGRQAEGPVIAPK